MEWNHISIQSSPKHTLCRVYGLIQGLWYYPQLHLDPSQLCLQCSRSGSPFFSGDNTLQVYFFHRQTTALSISRAEQNVEFVWTTMIPLINYFINDLPIPLALSTIATIAMCTPEPITAESTPMPHLLSRRMRRCVQITWTNLRWRSSKTQPPWVLFPKYVLVWPSNYILVFKSCQ